jgi:hypothetical protein
MLNMNYRKKLFTLLGELSTSPLSQDEAISFVADALGHKPRLIRAEVKAAIKVGHGQNKTQEEIEAAADGIHFFPPDFYYLKREDRAEYEARRERDIDLVLVSRGLSSRKSPIDQLSDVQRARLAIQSRSVTYAGPQTSHLAGPHTHGDATILVTRQPAFIEPAQGDYAPIMGLLNTMCGVGTDPLGEIQSLTLCGWLAQWDRAQHQTQSHVQGQILTIGGEPGIGKNRLTFFLGKLGGDRMYEPAKIPTNFNGDLLASTLAVAHDTAFPEDSADIREYWLGRKALVANADHRVEDKYIRARTMRLAGVRSIATFNLGHEAAKVIPPMLLESGMADKVIMLRGYGPAIQYPQQGTPEGRAWVEEILNSLPAFLWYLRHEFILPDQFKDVRYGVATFAHPEIRALIANSHPDAMLGELIDSWQTQRAIGGESGPWEGTMTALYDGLRNSETCGAAFSATCKSPQHLGHQIARLRVLPGWQARITSRAVWIGANTNQEQKLIKILPL